MRAPVPAGTPLAAWLTRMSTPNIGLIMPATPQDSKHCNRQRAVATGMCGDMAAGSHRCHTTISQQRHRCTVLLSLLVANSDVA